MFNETYKKLSLSPTSSRFKIYARNPLTEEIYKILHLRIEDKERAFNISEHKIHILKIKFARENREYLHRFIGKNLSTFIGKNMKIYLHANKKNPEIHLMSLCVYNPIAGSYFAEKIFKKSENYLFRAKNFCRKSKKVYLGKTFKPILYNTGGVSYSGKRISLFG